MFLKNLYGIVHKVKSRASFLDEIGGLIGFLV